MARDAIGGRSLLLKVGLVSVAIGVAVIWSQNRARTWGTEYSGWIRTPAELVPLGEEGEETVKAMAIAYGTSLSEKEAEGEVGEAIRAMFGPGAMYVVGSEDFRMNGQHFGYGTILIRGDDGVVIVAPPGENAIAPETGIKFRIPADSKLPAEVLPPVGRP